jgi:hypothetical protein
MKRRENLWIWISALAAAGIGWNLNLATWACEMDLGGTAIYVFGSDAAAKAAASFMRHLYEACGFAAAILMAAGLLAEASAGCPKLRPVDVHA